MTDEIHTNVTISELADHILGRRAESGADFEEANLPIMGGCMGCGASIGAYNAYPAKDGFLRCGDCIGDGGWPTVEEAKIGVFANEDSDESEDSDEPTYDYDTERRTR